METRPASLNLGGGFSAGSLSDDFSNSTSEEAVAKQRRLREAVLQELIDTEQLYVQDINTLVNVFYFPMQATKVVSEKDLQVIFSNVADVVPIHQAFLQSLTERFLAAKAEEAAYNVQIGDIFTRFTHYFKLYSIYTENQPEQLTKLDEATKTIKQFSSFLHICHGDSRCKGLQLGAFLIKPVQRLCKYPLLLRELIKNTPEDHPDFADLKAAEAKVQTVVSFVNEAKRMAEGQAKMREIEAEVSIEGLAIPDRYFHREGEFMLYQKGKPLQPRYLYLFNDLILLMRVKSVDPKTRKMHYEMRGRADLDKATVINIADDNNLGNLKHVIQITLEKQTFTLSAKSEAEKNQWLKDIKLCVKEFQKLKIQRLKNSGSAASSSSSK